MVEEQPYRCYNEKYFDQCCNSCAELVAESPKGMAVNLLYMYLHVGKLYKHIYVVSRVPSHACLPGPLCQTLYSNLKINNVKDKFDSSHIWHTEVHTNDQLRRKHVYSNYLLMIP